MVQARAFASVRVLPMLETPGLSILVLVQFQQAVAVLHTSALAADRVGLHVAVPPSPVVQLLAQVACCVSLPEVLLLRGQVYVTCAAPTVGASGLVGR